MSALADPTILVIDDENFSRRLAKLLLEREHYRVLTATQGQEGLLLAKVQQPDVILLDLMMPGLSGHETLKRLRDDPETASIPVIVVTAKMAEHDIATSFRLGATFHLEKPYETTDLVRKIQAALAFTASHGGR